MHCGRLMIAGDDELGPWWRERSPSDCLRKLLTLAQRIPAHERSRLYRQIASKFSMSLAFTGNR